MPTSVTPVERAVLGAQHPQDVLAWLDEACVALLGTPPRRVLWSAGRIAPVWQVELLDGTQLVLKARPLVERLHERLVATSEVQRLLRARGLPLPEVVRPPSVHTGLVVTFEAPLPGRWYEPHKASLTAVSAGQLAELIDAGVDGASTLESPAPWCDSDRAGRKDELWPAPHDPGLFGPAFRAVPAAARRLAEQSADALQDVWRSADRVIGHDDWEAQNLRLAADPDRVVAIYDGDSLAALPEAVLVGTAAAVHLAGSSYGDAAAPDAVGAFLDEYECARGRGVLDRTATHAAAAWTVAYNAACDAALGQTGPGTFLGACQSYERQYLG